MANGFRFELTDTGFSKALVDFYRIFGGDLGKIIRAQARLIAVNLTFQTQPFGGSKPTPGKQADEQVSGKSTGEGAVKRDINSIYTTPGRLFYMIRETSAAAAKGFYMLVRQRRFLQAEKLLQRLNIPGLQKMSVGDFDGGQLHQARQAPIPRRPRIKKSQKPELVIGDVSKINKYVLLVQKRVGMAKAGWAHCAQQLGGTGGTAPTDVEGRSQVMVPSWVKRHAGKTAVGRVEDRSSSRGNAFVSMTNTVPWVDKCLNRDQMQEALDIQRRKMETAIRKAAEYRARQVERQMLGF
jgi:hypothetical protein